MLAVSPRGRYPGDDLFNRQCGTTNWEDPVNPVCLLASWSQWNYVRLLLVFNGVTFRDDAISAWHTNKQLACVQSCFTPFCTSVSHVGGFIGPACGLRSNDIKDDSVRHLTPWIHHHHIRDTSDWKPQKQCWCWVYPVLQRLINTTPSQPEAEVTQHFHSLSDSLSVPYSTSVFILCLKRRAERSMYYFLSIS